MTERILKQGKEFHYVTPPQEDLRCADVSFSDKLRMFCIWFNGKLETFKSYQGMKIRLDKLIETWELAILDTEIK